MGISHGQPGLISRGDCIGKSKAPANRGRVERARRPWGETERGIGWWKKRQTDEKKKSQSYTQRVKREKVRKIEKKDKERGTKTLKGEREKEKGGREREIQKERLPKVVEKGSKAEKTQKKETKQYRRGHTPQKVTVSREGV